MRYIFILSLFLLFITIACQSNNNEPKKISGRELYYSRCATCHGADGKMGLNGAKDLPASALSLEERIHVITNGRNASMPAFKGLMTDEQIKAVAAYTTTMKSD